MWRPSVNSIALVLEGLCDLKVAHLLVFVEDLKRNDQFNSSILKLRDASGATIQAILPDRDAAHAAVGLGNISIRRGVVLYLQNTPIFIQKSPFTRYLILHYSCFRSILPSLPI